MSDRLHLHGCGQRISVRRVDVGVDYRATFSPPADVLQITSCPKCGARLGEAWLRGELPEITPQPEPVS